MPDAFGSRQAHREPMRWSKQSDQPVLEASFTIISDFGMTGQAVLVNQERWRALADAKLESFL